MITLATLAISGRNKEQAGAVRDRSEGCELTLPALAAAEVTIALPLQYSAPTTVAPEKFGEPGTPVSFGEVLPASGGELAVCRARVGADAVEHRTDRGGHFAVVGERLGVDGVFVAAGDRTALRGGARG